MRLKVDTKGFDEVLERFKLMDRAFKKEADVLGKASEIMLRALKEHAPKGETGNLESSMGIISKGMHKVVVGHANNIERTGIYHFYQNYGNSFTNATNYFSVAYFDVRDEVYQTIKDEILKAMGF
jgi:HK97 gp10 family phage protein